MIECVLLMTLALGCSPLMALDRGSGQAVESSMKLPVLLSQTTLKTPMPERGFRSDSGDRLPNAAIKSRWQKAINNDQTEELVKLIAASHDQRGLAVVRSETGKTAFMIACKTGALDFAEMLYTLGADPHAVTNTGGTPLMFAVLGNHPNIVKYLVGLEVDINAQGSNGWSATTIAAAKGYELLITYLLDIGADFNALDVYRWTPLMRAVDNGHFDAASILVSSPGVNLDNQDEAGNTALHHAAANNRINMVKMLLMNKANPKIENFKGQTARQLAQPGRGATSLLSLFPD